MRELKVCPVCAVETIHDERGACEICLERRALPPRGRGYIKLKVGTVVAVIALVIVVGFVHIVHGGNVGLTVCAKDGWSLSDNFVDLDDYIGKPLLANIDKAKVLRAMFACGTLERPHFGGDR